MKIAQALITVAILTIASTSFASSKCKHMVFSQGNTLMTNTVAPSSVVAADPNGQQGTQQAVR